jgi:uncharacterized protein YcfJ
MKIIILLSSVLLLFVGCSKEDSQIVGTGIGAAVGSEMAGKNDKVLGAAAGAIAGYWAGSKVGDAIEEEKQVERDLARTRKRGRRYRSKVKKYCLSRQCREWKYVEDGDYCTKCGGTDLVVEKYCRLCGRTWSPTADARYCHKCGERLRYR